MNPVLIFIIISPLTGAFLISLAGLAIKKFPLLPVGLAMASISVSLTMVVSQGRKIIAGDVLKYSLGGWPPPVGINLVFDDLSFFFSLLITFLALLILIYTFKKNEYTERFYSLFLLSISGMLGLVLTRDIFNFYVFFEVISLTAYILIFSSREPHSGKAAIRYFFMGSMGTAFLLLGIGILYFLTGTLNMDHLYLEITKISTKHPQAIMLSFILILVALGLKAGLFPFHTWIPPAHSMAPIPVSVLLSGLLIKIGVYGLIRLTYTLYGAEFFQFHLDEIIVYFGTLNVILAGVLALSEKELKKLLAYSSVSQMGFILIGFGLGNETGLQGSLFHILQHSLAKGGLFFGAGFMLGLTGKKEIQDLKGLIYRIPLPSLFFIICALSVVGFPPFGGFISKLYIFLGSLQSGFRIVGGAILLGVVLNAIYYFRIIQTLVQPANGEKFSPSFSAMLPIYVIGAVITVTGIFPSLIFSLLKPAVRGLMMR